MEGISGIEDSVGLEEETVRGRYFILLGRGGGFGV